MEMDTALGALADPIRRRVLELLADGDLSAGEIASSFEVSRPAVSRHLRVLRNAGLVRARRDSRRRVYAVDPGPLAEVGAWLEKYGRLWPDRLDRLEEHLRRTKEER